jgi:TolB-like protein/class 3 adenylate cyclase/cytochrome c-type biogenesis protein CcmH/NrfG
MSTAARPRAAILAIDVAGYSHLLDAGDESSLILAATRRLVGDGVGYTGLIRTGGEGMLERLQTHRQQLLDPKIAEYRGRILKTTGDGMLVEFASPLEAVRCAVEIQRAMIERNADTPTAKRITFRIGIDLGETSDDDDLPDDDSAGTVARLEGLTEPGGICISDAVRDSIRGLPYDFEDIGERIPKNGAAAVRAYAMNADAVASAPVVAELPRAAPARRRISLRSAVIAASVVATIGTWVAAGWVWLGRNPSPSPPAMFVATNPQIPLATGASGDAGSQKPSRPPLSVVVLPFVNLSNDPAQEYFADGITEGLTADLSQIPGSVVIARDTAFTYKGASVDARQIGRKLRVRYVLEGNVRRAGEQIWLDMALIDAQAGSRIWTKQFDTDRANLASAQEEITDNLARAVAGHPEGLAARRKSVRIDPDAHDLIMRGRAWFYRPYSVASWQEAQTAFERALEIDARSVEARVDLAKVLCGRLADGWSNSLQQDPARAAQLLQEALERDANRAAAHFAMGVLRRMQNRLTEAQSEFETAIALNPNNARASYQLGATLMFLGHPDAGIPPIKKAIRLDPNDPEVTVMYWALGTCHLLLGQVDDAVDFLDRARAANPRIWYPYLYLSGAFGLRGDIDTAKSALAESLKLKPEINSLARMRAYNAWITNPENWTLQEQTLNAGLRRAGLPDE